MRPEIYHAALDLGAPDEAEGVRKPNLSIRPSPTRVYLRTALNEYRRLFWVHNNKPNEMLLGLYGTSIETPILRYMWKEQELDTSELSKVDFLYEDAIEVNKSVDPIICHADGRIYVRTKKGEDLYAQTMQHIEPSGPDTKVFLELTLVSDVARHYSSIDNTVKSPDVWFALSGEEYYINLRGMFAGANFDVKMIMPMFAGHHSSKVLMSGALKGVLMGLSKKLEEEAMETRPRGTLLSFKFPVTEGRWHIKTFLFE